LSAIRQSTVNSTLRSATLCLQNLRGILGERSMKAAGAKAVCCWAFALLLTAGQVDAKREVLKFEIDGVTRSVLVYAPRNAGPDPLPLIVVYHGRGDDNGKFASAVKLHRDWPQAIVAYPRGEKIDTRPPMRGWQYRAGTYEDRDLKLTDQLLLALGQRYSIKPQMTFAAGFSNGGHFVFLLMAERSAAFAGFAAIGAIQPRFATDAPPRPVLYLFGRNEPGNYAEDWKKTVQALGRYARAGGKGVDYLSCCKWLAPREDGVVMAYGSYNAGHIWPYDGNAWLRDFFERVVAGPEQVDVAPD
jgi:poly(3-hydroxybutyrate) depolymerase